MDRTAPASSMPNPHCMKNTRAPLKRSQLTSAANRVSCSCCWSAATCAARSLESAAMCGKPRELGCSCPLALYTSLLASMTPTRGASPYACHITSEMSKIPFSFFFNPQMTLMECKGSGRLPLNMVPNHQSIHSISWRKTNLGGAQGVM